MTDENASSWNAPESPESPESPSDLDPQEVTGNDADQVKGGSKISQAKNDMQKAIIANFRV